MIFQVILLCLVVATTVENTCGSQLQANDVEQIITSPGYPNSYKRNHDCVWIITAKPENKILFTLNFLRLESGDSVEVSELLKVVGKYIGSISFPEALLSTGNSITVHFHSGSSWTNKGFNSTFIEVTCGENLVANSSTQMLPPLGYPIPGENEDCFWVITTSSKNDFVQFKIEHLSFEDEDSYLQVNGRSIGFGKFRNESTPIYLQSDGPRLTVYFHSGSNRASKSWRSNYKEVLCGATIITSKWSQSVRFPGTIKNASSNFTCDYTFLSTEDAWMKIDITDKHPSSCCSDVLIFKESVIIGKFDQQRTKNSYLLYGRRFRLHYVTNTSNYQWNRFYVTYRRFSNTCGSQLPSNEVQQSTYRQHHNRG